MHYLMNPFNCRLCFVDCSYYAVDNIPNFSSLDSEGLSSTYALWLEVLAKWDPEPYEFLI